jgi:hypothetical protein
MGKARDHKSNDEPYVYPLLGGGAGGACRGWNRFFKIIVQMARAATKAKSRARAA